MDLIDLNVKTPDNTVEMNDECTPEPIMSSSLLDETLSEEEERVEMERGRGREREEDQRIETRDEEGEG